MWRKPKKTLCFDVNIITLIVPPHNHPLKSIPLDPPIETRSPTDTSDSDAKDDLLKGGNGLLRVLKLRVTEATGYPSEIIYLVCQPGFKMKAKWLLVGKNPGHVHFLLCSRCFNSLSDDFSSSDAACKICSTAYFLTKSWRFQVLDIDNVGILMCGWKIIETGVISQLGNS